MTTVRQTVTTVQHSGGHGAAPGLDNSLDALLEDLQSSVARGGGGGGGAVPAVNGGVSAYRREVTRTMERDAPPQVMHLAPANPTTVVAERSASPLLPLGSVVPGEQRSVSYKTYSYQTYHTAASGDARSATLPAAPPAALTASSVSSAGSVQALGANAGANSADATSDARLQQNLHELDSLLVDLRHAQRAGFDPPPPAPAPAYSHAHAHAPVAGYPSTPHGNTTTTRTEVMTTSGGIDPGLLEPLDHSTPAPPSRGQHVVSTPTQQQMGRAVEYKTFRTERQHYSTSDGPGPAHGPVHGYGPAPDSPRLQPKRSSSAQRELVYGSEHVSRQRTRSPSPGGPHRREYVETRERYREKSPSHQRLQRDVMYNETTTTSSSGGGGTPHRPRYREPSPPPQQQLRRGPSPSPGPQHHQPGGEYPGGGGSSSRTVTTVRTYNYSTGGSNGGPGGPVGPAGPSPVPGGPPSRGRSPSPSPQRPPYRSPSPVSMQQRPALVDEYNPPRGRSPSPGPRSPRVNQHTTVHTYTYDGHGGPPAGYHQQPPPPQPATTVTTYKYSTSSSDRRYPGPEEQPLLQPRPFPTPSPTPPAGGQPPKRLDDLMASFSDSEHEHPPGSYYRTTTERTVSSSRDGGPVHGVPSPAPAPAPGPAPPATNGAAVGSGALVAADAKAKEAQLKDRTPTTNVAGPPVYYPPGVEMFAQREESSMQMSGGGGKAKGKYKYEYESKEKSKSSQSGGAAVVPICLPLCCGMPCVIM